LSTDTTSTAPHPAPSGGPRWPRLRRELLIILFLTAFAIAVTWPLVTKMTSEIVGGTGDSHLFYWNYWWFNHALFELKQDPFFCPIQLYPYGADLAFHTLCPFNCLLALPFQRLFGIPFAYNLVILFSLIAAAYTAYRLAFDLTTDRVASVAAGIMFGFSPYMLMRATGHINLVGAWPLPLVAMFSMRAFKTARYRWAALAGLFGGLQLWISMYYALFSAILFLLLWINALRSKGRNLRIHVFGPAVCAAGALSAGAPIIYVVLRSVLTSGAYLAPEWRSSFGQGVDFLGFLVPGEVSMIFGKATYPIYTGLYGGGIEGLAFAGILCLVCAAVAVRFAWNSTTRLFAVLALVFGILALGDRLHVADHDSLTVFGWQLFIPLPAALLKPVPILNMIRVASRFVILFQLALVCLAALGVTHLLKKCPGRYRKAIVIVLFICLFLDLACIPYFTSPVRHGRLYRILKQIPDDFALMDVPFGVGDAVRWHGIHTNQTVARSATQLTHEKSVLGTLASRVDPQVLARLQKSPLVSAIVDAQTGQMTERTLEALTPSVVQRELAHFKLKVIIVHHGIDKQIDIGQLAYLFKHIGFKLLYRGEQLAVIETPLGPSLEKYVPRDKDGAGGVSGHEEVIEMKYGEKDQDHKESGSQRHESSFFRSLDAKPNEDREEHMRESKHRGGGPR